MSEKSTKTPNSTKSKDDSKEAMFLTSQTNGKWTKAINENNSVTDDYPYLHGFLSETLRSENLSILAGAGSSMGVWESNTTEKRIVPTRAGLWSQVSSIWDGDVKDLFETVCHNNDAHPGDIEHLLSQCHLYLSFNNNEAVAQFVEEIEAVIVSACRFVNSASKLDTHTLFLRKAARRSQRLPRLKIFTTNYDLCFEQAAQKSGFVLIDGFSHTLPQEFDSSYFSYDIVHRGHRDDSPDYISNVAHLYKLHGSVDWNLIDGTVRREIEPISPLLIYPRSSKYEHSYQPPFIETMGHFQSALRERNSTLIVVGFGFADEHITQPILSAVRSNASMRIIVVDPNLQTHWSSEPLHWLESLVRHGDTRICLFDGTFTEFVQLLPDPSAQSEDEIHLSRLRGI